VTASSYGISAYPNPVSSGVLNVQIEETETAEASNGLGLTEQASTGQNVARQPPVYTIRLYNALGVMVRDVSSDGETTQLSVSGLPNGIYTLQVHDGSENPPQTQHIVISN
jgi:hypothetical protein